MRDQNTGDWLEPSEGIDLSTEDGRLFKKEPAINVISKEDFEIRVEKVFNLLWKTLAKSFGPYGAPTLICNYPWRHMTKDGFTIMKNLSFDASETKVDQAISDMAQEICGRLNYSVGDGTTSAIIATNSIYQNYRSKKNELNDKFILPRDIISKYEVIKNKIIDELTKYAKPIQTKNVDELYENIKNVVYISSNANELITQYIAELYKELGAPAISCIKAPDGITKKKLINGYRYELSLADRLYINTDENTMDLSEADVIIFGTKIGESTYKKLLKPLSFESKMRGRHLIVCAPTYDEIALNTVIAPELNAEWRKDHNVNMILMRYRAISSHTRKLINDFSILMDTDVIDRAKEKYIIDKIDSGVPIHQLVQMDTRHIVGTKCIAIKSVGENDSASVTYVYGVDNIKGYTPLEEYYTEDENALHLGYTRSCSLGLTYSQFMDLNYDQRRYDTVLAEAEVLLKEAEQKYQKLGTFNVEVNQCQERLYALKLKMGIIEVGADSEVSQGMLKDAVDDAVKAAESAYKYGTILGCNTNLIQSIREVLNSSDNTTDRLLLEILYNGFKDVYKTVLLNAFPDYKFDTNTATIEKEIKHFVDDHFGNFDEIFEDNSLVSEVIELCDNGEFISLHDFIVEYSLLDGRVFDISKFRFSNDVINSLQTDSEILTATIDLISLLIVGNQMVVTQRPNV